MAKNTEAHMDRVEDLAKGIIGCFSIEYLMSTSATIGPVVENSRMKQAGDGTLTRTFHNCTSGMADLGHSTSKYHK